VDNFEGTSLGWASLGHEAHRLDTMAHTPDDEDCLWRLERHLRVLSYPFITPMTFLWRLECYILGLGILLGLGFGGGRVDLIETCHFLMGRRLGLMDKTLAHKEEAF
jgi:hypothetical protein